MFLFLQFFYYNFNRSTDFNRPNYENTRPHVHTSTLDLILVILCVLTSGLIISQNRQEYYVIAKPNIVLEPIIKTVELDSTLTLDLVHNGLENFFNNLPVYSFKKEFTSSNSPYLKRVYKVTLDNASHLQAIFSQQEIEYAELVKYPEPLFIPNDYQALFQTPLTAMVKSNSQKLW